MSQRAETLIIDGGVSGTTASVTDLNSAFTDSISFATIGTGPDSYSSICRVRDSYGGDFEYVESVQRITINNSGFYTISCWAMRHEGSQPASFYVRFFDSDGEDISAFQDTTTTGWSNKSDFYYWQNNVADLDGFAEQTWIESSFTFGTGEGNAGIPTNATTFAVGIRVARWRNTGDTEDYEWQFTGYELYHSFV